MIPLRFADQIQPGAFEYTLNHVVDNDLDLSVLRESAFHIQGVNNYHQRLRGWIRRFNGVSIKYLPHYLGWLRWFDQQ